MNRSAALALLFGFFVLASAQAWSSSSAVERYKLLLAQDIQRERDIGIQVKGKKHPSCRGLATLAACAERVYSQIPPRSSASLALRGTVVVAAVISDVSGKGRKVQLEDELKLVDSVLSMMERFNTNAFIIREIATRNPNDALEIAQLKRMESEMLEKGKAKLLTVLQEKMVDLHKKLTTARAPADTRTVELIKRYNSLNIRYEALRNRPPALI